MHSSHDPKGLIRESYRIEGISDAECRSILIDWALSLPEEADQREALGALLDLHGIAKPDHPMTYLLKAGLENPAPRRGRRRRERQSDAG